MSTPAALPPPQALYPLPERREAGLLERAVEGLRRRFSALGSSHRAGRLAGSAGAVAREAAALAGLSGEDRGLRLRALRSALRRHGLARGPAAEALALAGAAAAGAWGRAPAEPAYRVALALAGGRVAETGPGEAGADGLALAAVAWGLTGWPVHVTGADPAALEGLLAKVGPLAERLGVRVARIEPGQSPADRQAAYRADVTVGMPREFVSDALCDAQRLLDRPGNVRLRLERLCSPRPRAGQLVQRGAVVGLALDADVVLLDQALATVGLQGRAGGAGEEEAALALAWDVAGLMSEGEDYTLSRDAWPVLTRQGRDRLREMLLPRGGAWAGAAWRERLVGIAVMARSHLEPGRHYKETGQGIDLVDAGLARLDLTEYWKRILRSLLCLRHGVPLPPSRAQLATMTQMQCFLRYRCLAGTVRHGGPATRRELAGLYGLECLATGAGASRGATRYRHEVLDDGRAVQEWLPDLVARSRTQGRAALVLGEPETRSDGWVDALAGKAWRIARLEDGDPPGARDVDVVLGSGAWLAQHPWRRPFPPGEAPGDVILLAPVVDRSREERLAAWLGTEFPAARVHRLVVPDRDVENASARGAVARLAARASARRWPGAAWLAGRVASRLAGRLPRARRDHQRSLTRMRKLLAFTGAE